MSLISAKLAASPGQRSREWLSRLFEAGEPLRLVLRDERVDHFAERRPFENLRRACAASG